MENIPDNLQIEHLIWKEGIRRIVGIDEAGRGPLAGPVVAAAVVFEPYHYIEGVTDSKKLTQRQREELYHLIVEQAVSYGIGVVDNQEIDRINIRQATFKAMRKAIGSLSVKPEYLLLDGEELPEKIYPQEAIVKGDSLCFTIAAASILAKVSRDRMMIEYHQQYPQYGFAQHKGYGTEYHRKMIQSHGPCPLHRHSFLTRILNSSSS
ncbi:MAG: ribonuclease HII [Calditrichaeota bacterium]|nr:MAG: ribonuclease HII [Calditrichota bacterium]